MSLLISVVICTRNRAGLLARALESVCRQSSEAGLYEVVVDKAVGGHQLAGMDVRGIAVESRGFAARFFYEKPSCRHVPRFEVDFPETVEPSRRHIAKVQRGAPIAARAHGALGEDPPLCQVVPLGYPGIVGEPGGEQCLPQLRSL